MEDVTVVWTMLINICGKFMYIKHTPKWKPSWPGTLYHSIAFLV